MGYTLSPEELEVMKEVRVLHAERVAQSNDLSISYKYICGTINKALAKRANLEDWDTAAPGKLPEKERKLYTSLTRAIQSALDGRATMGRFIMDILAMSNNSVTSNSVRRISNEFAPLARMAWLDRIIETGVIA